MMIDKSTDLYFDDGTPLAFPKPGDEDAIHCLMQTARRYNINLSEATKEEREFVLARAAENYKKPVAV